MYVSGEVLLNGNEITIGFHVLQTFKAQREYKRNQSQQSSWDGMRVGVYMNRDDFEVYSAYDKNFKKFADDYVIREFEKSGSVVVEIPYPHFHNLAPDINLVSLFIQETLLSKVCVMDNRQGKETYVMTFWYYDDWQAGIVRIVDDEPDSKVACFESTIVKPHYDTLVFQFADKENFLDTLAKEMMYLFAYHTQWQSHVYINVPNSLKA